MCTVGSMRNLKSGFILFSILLTVAVVAYYSSQTVDARREDQVRASISEMTEGQDFSSSRIRVVYKDDLEKFEAARTTESRKGLYKVVEVSEVTGKSEGNGAVANTSESVENVEDALYELLSDPEVAYAAPDYLGHIAAWTDNGTQSYPGDYDVTGPTFNQWYYDAGKVKEMWDDQGCPSGPTCGGDSSVVVGVLDTGVAYDAFDDQTGDGFTENNFTAVMDDVPNLWTNSGEIAGNGMDDDCNGVIDDVHGIDTFAFTELEITDVVGGDSLSERTCNSGTPVDFSGTSNTFRRKPGHPVDTYGHGTFVTGLIAGQVDNGGDTVSPAFNVSIMPLAASINTTNNTHTSQVYDSGDYSLFWMSDVQTAIEYAGVNGVDIINMSIGGFLYDQLFQDQIDYWYSEGVLFVAASGNDSTSGTMQGVSYPAAFDNVIAVGAVNADNTRSDYSNGGAELDLVAYVGEVNAAGTAAYQETLTCYGCTSAGPFNNTASDTSTGTSFAAPQVAAAAAIIKSNNMQMTSGEIYVGLIDSVTDINAAGYDNGTGFGVLDFEQVNQFSMSNADVENFTVYRYINGDRAWIWVGNPSITDDVYINVNINGEERGFHVISPQENLPLEYINTFSGPVKITGSSSIHVSQKMRTVAGKLNESLAVPASHYSTDFWYPVYRHINGDGAWVWIANPNYTGTATVNVTLDGVDMGEVEILPRQNTYLEFAGVFSGPVKLTSDIPIYTTMKSRTGGGLEEFSGISTPDLATEFYYPIYRHINGDGAWIWVGNPDTENDVNINVEIAGQDMGDSTVPAGQNIFLEFQGVFDGPVKITAENEIYSTIKSRTGGVINEFSGIKSSDFSTSYSFPIYRYINGDQAWIWIGNPSETLTANISISIAGSTVGTYQVLPGEVGYADYPGVFAGPVRITSDIPIYSTLKSRSSGSLNEFVGIHD